MAQVNKMILRSLIETYQDLQNLRIQLGNRLLSNFRFKLGQHPNKKLEDPTAQKIFTFLKSEYQRISDVIAQLSKKSDRLSFFKKQTGLIEQEFEYEFSRLYFEILNFETMLVTQTKQLVQGFPIWEAFLKNVPGVGPIIAGYLVSYLDPHRAPYPSSFWHYAGLHVVDGKAPRKQRGQKCAWNHRLRAKLLGVLGDQFVKRPGTKYGQIYRDYKHRLENHPKWQKTSKMHRHRAAVRYAVKIFLRDLWVAWRKVEGLPVVPDYAEAKLGLQHRKAA